MFFIEILRSLFEGIFLARFSFSFVICMACSFRIISNGHFHWLEFQRILQKPQMVQDVDDLARVVLTYVLNNIVTSRTILESFTLSS